MGIPESIAKVMCCKPFNDPSSIRVIGCVIGVVGSLLVYGVLQERIMSQPYSDAGKDEFFSYSVFLVLSNRVLGCLMAAVILAITKGNVTPVAGIHRYAVVSLSNVVATTCQYEALKYLSFPVQTLGKCAKMIPVMIWGFLINQKRYGMSDVGIAIAVTAGCTIFGLYGDESTLTSNASKGANVQETSDRRFGIRTQAAGADQSMSFSMSSGEACANETFLREEIWQLEDTLQQRHRELGRVDQDLKQARRELKQAREGRTRADRDAEQLAKKSLMLSKEVAVFDRKAEEATMELLMAQERLEDARDAQRTIEANVDALKMDLFGYLKSVQAEYKFGAGGGQPLEQIILGSAASQFEMRHSLKDLDGEIQARKAELAALKDRSRELAGRFQEEEARHGEALAATRRQQEQLSGQVAALEADLDAKQALLDEKAQLIEQLEGSVERLGGAEREAQQRVDETEAKFAEKCGELENAEKLLAKYMDNLESMRGDETEMVKGLEKVSADIQQEKENYDRLKQVINDLVNNKNQMEAKCQAISEMVERVGDEYEKREQQLIKLNSQVKERQAAAKRDKEEAQEAEAAREGAQQELAALKDRHRRKRVECERLEQNCSLYETRLAEQSQEANAYQQKVAEAKQQWEALGAAVEEGEARLKELMAKAGQQQAAGEQAESQVAASRAEAEELEAYVQQLRAECQREKKTLNGVQTEMLKQKKVYEELKAKSKNCTRQIAGAEADMERAEQMQEKIKAKDSYIIELENCILEKNKEMSLLQQSFLKNQEQTAQFQERLAELEEQTRNTHVSFENDLQNFLNNFSDQESDYLTDTQPPFATPNTKSLLNSLLITPSLRKAYSNNLVGLLASGASSKENCEGTADQTKRMAVEPSQFSSSLFHQPVKLDRLNEKTNLILDEQERYKDALLSKFSEKMSRLDQSQRQTKTSIDSLKSNLGEIERLTANNIFKITSISK